MGKMETVSEQQPQKSQPSILLLSLLDRVNKEKVNKKGKEENIEPLCYVGEKKAKRLRCL